MHMIVDDIQPTIPKWTHRCLDNHNNQIFNLCLLRADIACVELGFHLKNLLARQIERQEMITTAGRMIM
jgi:hypothetical protein